MSSASATTAQLARARIAEYQAQLAGKSDAALRQIEHAAWAGLPQLLRMREAAQLHLLSTAAADAVQADGIGCASYTQWLTGRLLATDVSCVRKTRALRQRGLAAGILRQARRN